MEIIFEAILMTMSIVIISAQHCTSSRSTGIQLSLKSNRNDTGHWNGQIQIKHPGKADESGPWEVELEQVIEKCDDFENVMIIANFSGPSSKFVKKRRTLAAGYELIPEMGYYKFHTDVKTWFEARDTCHKEGAHLLIINSDREAYELLKFWAENPNIAGFTDWRKDWAYVGINDQHVEGQYVTIFGEPLKSTAFKWNPGQPHNGEIGDCCVVYRINNFLGDTVCSISLPFFCEQEL